jgi:nucleotide-binding universal stress UspA family protein
MSIKTILVHVAKDDHHMQRLKVALELARRHQAHIVALFTTRPVGMPHAVAGRAASAGFLAEATRSARETAHALEEELARACERDRISHTWVVEDGDHLELLAQHAHVADLAVVSQFVHEHLEDHFRLRLSEELVLAAGCPVLIVPRTWDSLAFGRRILVAWKSTRESIRAVRDSLDFLRAAELVVVLSIGGEPAQGRPAHEVVSYLQRHGITAVPRIDVDDEEDNVGRVILRQAEAHSCDMVVMGGYGHSRLREVMLGGTTRHVFEHMTIPVVMSH